MKKSKYFLISILFIFLFNACQPGEIQIQNNLSHAILKNIEWGDVAISQQLIPGEMSSKISIYNDSYSDIDLPEKKPIKFYMEVNGDLIYLQTKMEYLLDYNQYLLITIDDSTQVFNPMLEN